MLVTRGSSLCFSIRPAGVSTVTIFPWSMMATRSHTACASSIECVVRSTLRPLSRIFSIRFHSWRLACGSTGGRLVEEHEWRIMDRRDHQGQALLLPAGKLAESLRGLIFQAHRTQYVARALPGHGDPAKGRK